ncbi:MAG: nucleotidyltransferase family protein [Crocosphaera sp.]|nr:nucleotidyltransferase family protein [Crocosphaera sp.]
MSDNLKQRVHQKRTEIQQIAAKYGANNIRIFGSVARGDAKENSDIDFLMDIEAGHSLLHRISLIQELEDLLNCKVDVVKPQLLHETIKEQVLKESIPL